MPTARLLILIPAYNEENRIGPMLRKYAECFRDNYSGEHQLLVVLNGCRDGTLGVVQEAAKSFPSIRWVVFPAPIGKGGALIEGLKLDQGYDYIGYTDADGSTEPISILNMVEHIDGVDCVVGSRRMPGSVINQSQPSHRMLASRVFHIIVQGLLRLNIHDTQCGAKVMRVSAARHVLPMLQISDMAFDVNLLYSLKKAGFKLREVPVEWTDHIGSKVRYFRTSLVMFLSIVRLRLIYSPFHVLFPLLRPFETWLYLSLRSAPPLPVNPQVKDSVKSVQTRGAS